MFTEINKKYKYLIKLFIATVAVYILFKYMLPLFFPFLLAILIAHLVSPIVNNIQNKYHIKRELITGLMIIIVTVIIGLIIILIVSVAAKQAKNFITNIGYYERKFEFILDNGCCKIGQYFGIPNKKTISYIEQGIKSMYGNEKSAVVKRIMGTSVCTLRFIIEFLVIILTALVAAYYLVVNEEEVRKSKKNNMFYKEITRITTNVSTVCSAYVRTQCTIMGITAVICFTGFTIIRNPYAFVLSLIVSFLDALPLLGIGVILVPFMIILYITKSYFSGTVILITFLICYIVREVIEPKLMGHQIGITPLMTIISMYIGYKIFSIPGVVLGPIGYIILSSIMFEENGNDV